MNIEQERAEFEAKFPMPDNCQWCGNGYAPTAYSAWGAQSYVDMFRGWIARSALQSQKPKTNDLMLSAVIRMPLEMAMADPISRTQFYQRAQQALNELEALQSQDREDAEWMTCESRRPYVVNSLKHIAKELRDAERRSRNTFKKGYMGEPARYFADACGEAAALFEAKLEAIDHARRVEGEGK